MDLCHAVYSKTVMSQNDKMSLKNWWIFAVATNTIVSFNLGRQYKQLLYAMIYAQMDAIGQNILETYAGKQLS
jgi:hypothetical protein